jgi:hypothetical protein
MERPSIEIVQDRLQRLERKCRLWKWLGTAAVLTLVVTAAALFARRNEVRSEIRARSLWIVDEHDRPLVRIGHDIEGKRNGLIEFLDESGRPSVEMGIASAGSPFIRLSGREGRDELVLDIGDARGVGITLRDRKRDSGLMIATSPDGIAGIGVLSPGGKPVLDFGVQQDGSGLFSIHDTEGKELLLLPKP